MKGKILKKPVHPCKKDCPNREAQCANSCSKWKEYESLRNQYYKDFNSQKDIDSSVKFVYGSYN